MNKQTIIESLEQAINRVENTGPVNWAVRPGESYVQLIGTYDAPKEDDGLWKEPELTWTRYGGDKILAVAELTDQWNKSGVEGYTDKWGNEVVSDWVQFDISED